MIEDNLPKPFPYGFFIPESRDFSRYNYPEEIDVTYFIGSDFPADVQVHMAPNYTFYRRIKRWHK